MNLGLHYFKELVLGVIKGLGIKCSIMEFMVEMNIGVSVITENNTPNLCYHLPRMALLQNKYNQTCTSMYKRTPYLKGAMSRYLKSFLRSEKSPLN